MKKVTRIPGTEVRPSAPIIPKRAVELLLRKTASDRCLFRADMARVNATSIKAPRGAERRGGRKEAGAAAASKHAQSWKLGRLGRLPLSALLWQEYSNVRFKQEKRKEL